MGRILEDVDGKSSRTATRGGPVAVAYLVGTGTGLCTEAAKRFRLRTEIRRYGSREGSTKYVRIVQTGGGGR